VVWKRAANWKVTVHDGSGNRDLVLRPDLLVLSVGIAPAAGNPVLSACCAAPHRRRFLPRSPSQASPVDLANEGEFLCGLAHSPRFIDETIVQAQAAAGRASTILSKAFLEIPGQVARVNPEDCVASPRASRSARTARP